MLAVSGAWQGAAGAPGAPDEQVTAMRTDGESLYVNPEYLIHRFGENPENVYEEYLRLIRQCIEMPESFGKETEKQKAICKKWKEIAKELAITYGAGGKRRGENRGGQKEELSEIEKGKYDYRRFLLPFYCYKRGDETGSGCL